MAVSILLADDHPVLRRGMRSLFETVPDFSVVGDAGDGLMAVKLVEKLKPDVLVLDLMMPGITGLEVLRTITPRFPKTHTVVLSMYSNKPFIAEALRSGAAAYVLKGCSEESLLRAVREAAAGRQYLSPPITEMGIEDYLKQTKPKGFDPNQTLTPRERQVLQLSAVGKSGPEIADALRISHRTVENHRAHLMRKLGLQNQSELVMHAIKRGIIPIRFTC